MKNKLLFKHVSFLFVVCCMILYISAPAFSQDSSSNFVVREVAGHGSTKEFAVVNGLIEAIRQIEGIDISSVRLLRNDFIEVMKTNNGEENDSSSFSAEQQSKILSKTKGRIKSYEIINFEKSNDGFGWNVFLRVEVSKYETPGIPPDNRRKIAVIPFKTAKKQFNYFKANTPSTEISSQLAQRLLTEITQSRRFSVMDREYMDEYLQEKNLILSPDASINELSKVGEVLGVDYLIVGNIIDATLIKKTYLIEITGESGTNYSASFIVDYRIIVMATRQVKWANTISLSFDNSDLLKIDPDLRQDNLGQVIITTAAKKIVYNAMDNIYPIRVVKVEQNSNTIILNQGGVSLAVGESLDVFSIGENVKDPYTGESLGAVETWVADAEITRVNPKMSYAKIIKGDIAKITNGSICRRINKKYKQPESSVFRKNNVKILDNGGVKLPFD